MTTAPMPVKNPPHTLHAEWSGDAVSYRLDCPWGREIGQAGRPCNLVTENDVASPDAPDSDDYTSEEWLAYGEAMDAYEPWIPIPGCFAAFHLNEYGPEVIDLNITDPTFPLNVGVSIDGSHDDACATIVNYETADA